MKNHVIVFGFSNDMRRDPGYSISKDETANKVQKEIFNIARENKRRYVVALIHEKEVLPLRSTHDPKSSSGMSPKRGDGVSIEVKLATNNLEDAVVEAIKLSLKGGMGSLIEGVDYTSVKDLTNVQHVDWIQGQKQRYKPFQDRNYMPQDPEEIAWHIERAFQEGERSKTSSEEWNRRWEEEALKGTGIKAKKMYSEEETNRMYAFHYKIKDKRIAEFKKRLY